MIFLYVETISQEPGQLFGQDRWEKGPVCVGKKFCGTESVHEVLVHIQFHICDFVPDIRYLIHRFH